jgi:DNA-directed RNA polymerase specialized sigma24 family protein
MPKERWETLEDYVQATLPGAWKTANSGAVRGDGDVLTQRYLVECKSKGTAAGISLSKAEVRKAMQQAVKKARQPLFVMENELQQKWACLPYDEFVRIMEILQMMEDQTIKPKDE